jgi:hypothetical protein
MRRILPIVEGDGDMLAVPELIRRVAADQGAARLARAVPVEFVFMVQEFETLFLADSETTRHVFPDIPSTSAFPEDPERIRDAKGWLSQARPKGSAYKPTQHQQKLTARVDLARLRVRSPSFVQFEAAVTALLADSSTIEHA